MNLAGMKHSTTLRAGKTFFSLLAGVLALLLSIGLAAPAAAVTAQSAQASSPFATIQTVAAPDGTTLAGTIIHGPPTPPAGFEAQRAAVQMFSAAAKILTVPAYSWELGCSSVSAAMIAGYYDRNSYPKMYTGPTNGGVMPLTDTAWPGWTDSAGATYPNNPLIASHLGLDGRTTRGTIDDYWVKYNSTTSDPYLTGGWAQHAWGSAVGDYLKTSQSSHSNPDGSTQFYSYPGSSSKLQCSTMPSYGIQDEDGTYGRKLFYESKGYTVSDCYNQPTDNAVAGGFSLGNYRSEIDAGHPVFINLAGHSIVGVGYDSASSTIYIHDTWDANNHTMTWGGSYAGMAMQSVSIVNLAPLTAVSTPQSPAGSITDTTPTYTWTKVSSATQYQYTLLQGTTTVYSNTVASTACGTSTCTNTPSTALSSGSYAWKVRAYAGGTWGAYSGTKAFSVAAPTGFNSPFNGGAANWVKRPGAAWTIGSATYWTNGQSAVLSSASYNAMFTNFTYQARLKRAASVTAGETGLIVRGNATFATDNRWKTAYYFGISSHGDFTVYKLVNGTKTMLKGWTVSPAVVAKGWNTLKVVASGTSLKFSVNGTPVWSATDASIASGQVGVYTWSGGTSTERLDVDWATLTAN